MSSKKYYARDNLPNKCTLDSTSHFDLKLIR